MSLKDFFLNELPVTGWFINVGHLDFDAFEVNWGLNMRETVVNGLIGIFELL